MKRFSRFITEKKMTHVIDRKTGESVYGPTDVADAKRYLQKQPQPRKFMIRDIKESVELEDGKYVTVKQFVSDEAAQSAISDAEGLLDSTEIMAGVFAMVFDSEESKEQFTTKHKSDIKEEVEIAEALKSLFDVKPTSKDWMKGKLRTSYNQTNKGVTKQVMKKGQVIDLHPFDGDRFVGSPNRKDKGKYFFIAKYNVDVMKEDVQIDENVQNQAKRMSRRDKQKLADKLNDLDLSGYGDYEARVDNVHKFKPSDLKMAMQMMSLKEAPNPEFLKVYDKLKKGDKVDVEFDSGIRKGHKVTLVVTSGHRVVGRSKVGRIILKSPDNMRGVRYTLYNRDGSVSLALGDMGTVLKSIKKK